ncbi:MAG: hypothetical protein JWO93_1470 [Micrococcaceae bacterium]|nr:hypothetical protein [Micrococcaceae bacterium]
MLIELVEITSGGVSTGKTSGGVSAGLTNGGAACWGWDRTAK